MNGILVILLTVDHLPTNIIIKCIASTSEMYTLYSTINNRQRSLLAVMKTDARYCFRDMRHPSEMTRTHCSYSTITIFYFLNAKLLQSVPNEAHFCFPFCLVSNLVQLHTIKTFKSKMGP